MNNTKGHGFFRKSKAYGLVAGIALAGTLFVGASTASADEVATTPAAGTETQATSESQPTAVTSEALTKAVETAQSAGVTVTEDTTPQTYITTDEANKDLAAQTTAVEAATTAQTEADTIVNNAVEEAKSAGTTVNNGGTITVEADRAKERAEQVASNIKTTVQENQAIAQANAAKKQAYDTATNVETTLEARTQNVDNLAYGDSFMNGAVNSETGEFSLTHDLVDGVNRIGVGTLTGRVNKTVTALGDGQERVTVTSIELFNYVYQNLVANSAVNQNINFHVYDLAGNHILEILHNGNTSFTRAINGTYAVGSDVVLNPNEESQLVQLLSVDDNWIYNTHGQVLVKFRNTNVTPTYENPKEATSYKVNVTVNTHPVQVIPLTFDKQVHKDGQDVENGTLKIGDKGNYTLVGGYLTPNRAESLWQYDFEDLMDTTHDKYLGYNVYAFKPITLKDGTVIESLADLKAFAQQSYDEATGRFYLSLSREFLDQVSDDSEFQVAVDINFERIAAGEVWNTAANIVNGVRTEDKVVTNTPENPTPAQPQAPATPQGQAAPAQLPQTGEESTTATTALGMLMLGIIGMTAFLRKRKTN